MSQDGDNLGIWVVFFTALGNIRVDEIVWRSMSPEFVFGSFPEEIVHGVFKALLVPFVDQEWELFCMGCVDFRVFFKPFEQCRCSCFLSTNDDEINIFVHPNSR